MNFNKHSTLEGDHAFLSASKYHWVNYDEKKLVDSYTRQIATRRGTELHDFACRSINLKIKLPNTCKSLNMYVNDAIGFKMTTEQVLFYSENCFGTADSISFRNENIKKNEDWRRFNDILRIHDLKTGVTPASITQLEIYAALFCLEYNYKPNEIDIELRLYQSDEALIHHPNPDDIFYIMDKIIIFDKIIEKIKSDNGINSGNFDLAKLLKIVTGK